MFAFDDDHFSMLVEYQFCKNFMILPVYNFQIQYSAFDISNNVFSILFLIV